MDAIDRLTARLEKLETENRRLRLVGFGCVCGFCFLALVAWRSPNTQKFESLQVQKLEVVDSRGVPLITLSPNRNNAGGSIVLRDSSGDKRSWWETEPGIARIVFESANATSDDKTIAGLSSVPGCAQLSLLGPKGGSVVSMVQRDRPSVTLQDTNGRSLFTAPWTK